MVLQTLSQAKKKFMPYRMDPNFGVVKMWLNLHLNIATHMQSTRNVGIVSYQKFTETTSGGGGGYTRAGHIHLHVHTHTF